MEDIINTVVKDYWGKGKSIEAIRKYIKTRYGINIERKALLKRLEFLNIQYQV